MRVLSFFVLRIAVLVGSALTPALRAQTNWTSASSGTAAPMAPTILLSPLGLSETIGGAASFVVSASGSPPLSFQWFRDGLPLAGETRSALTRAPLTAGDAGDYFVTVTNPAGTVTSSFAKLTLLPAPAPVVDLSFNADPSLNGSPTALLPLTDGSVLVADGKKGQLVKLRPNGSLDPSWAVNSFGPVELASAPFITVLTAQPDGRILVGGSFATFTGPPRTNLIRLNSDGTIDLTFAPAVEATTSAVTAIALQADNRILIANNGTIPLRLLTDGRLDPTFLPQPLTPGVTRFGQQRNWGISSVAAAANGKVVVAANVDLRFTNDYPLPNYQVVRLQDDGTTNPSFVPVTAGGSVRAMRVLTDDGVLLLGSGPGQFGILSSRVGFVARVRNDASAFPGYSLSGMADFPGAPYIYPDGSFIVTGNSQLGPIRYTPLGEVDPSFTGGVGHPSVTAAASNGQVYVAGTFDLYNGKPSQRVARLNSVANGSLNAPRILSFIADKTTVSFGDLITVRAAVTGSADLTFEWDGAPNVFPATLSTVSPTLTFTFQSRDQPNTLQLIARNPSGAATSDPILFTVLPDPPVITSQPKQVSAQSGRDLSLTIQRNSNAGNILEFEWRRNGQILPQAPGWFFGTTLFIPKVTATDAGTYTVTLRNALGAEVTSAPILLTIDDSSRLANLSTRAFAGPGEQTLIAGFSISGARPRTVLLRGIGPGLAKFGVTGALPDPQIALFSGASQYSHDNGGWDSNADDGGQFVRSAFATVGAFPLDPGSKDTVIFATIAPGNYTVQLTSVSGQTGTALVEIYEDDNDAARMLNVSSRAMVAPGSPAICGLSIQGPAAKRVLLRGVGPALGTFGIAGVLVNPRLTLKDAGGTTVAANEDWETNSNVSDLRAAMTSVGAFALSIGSKDAALLVNLPPGNYTMIVEGGPGQSGVALVEAYEVP